MIFHQLFDNNTSTYTYLLGDEASGDALLIDPVRDHVERDIRLLKNLGLTLRLTLETHVHADHISGAGLLRKQLGSTSLAAAHSGADCIDRGLSHEDTIELGAVALQVRSTPGHTSGCLTYVDHANRRVFTGDTLLIGGTGRTDFQQGDASELYKSINEQIFALSDDFEVFPGHDYNGRAKSTVGAERLTNPRLAGKSPEQFVEIMGALKLPFPRHIDTALPANLRCGMLDEDGPLEADSAWAPLELREDGLAEVSASWAHSRPEQVRLVDVREPGETTGDIPSLASADCVPLREIAQQARTWDRNERLLVVCRSGMRSLAAAAALKDLGFRRVASVRGGMVALSQGHKN